MKRLGSIGTEPALRVIVRFDNLLGARLTLAKTVAIHRAFLRSRS